MMINLAFLLVRLLEPKLDPTLSGQIIIYYRDVGASAKIYYEIFIL